MKSNKFFLIIIFAFNLLSSNSYSNVNNLSKREESKDQLYVMGSRNMKLEEDFGPYDHALIGKLIPPEELVFTGDNIISYNLNTKKIIFTDSVYNKLLSTPYQIFNVYSTDTLLLENIIQTYGHMSWPILDLVVYFEFYDFYLCYGNPDLDLSQTEWVQEKIGKYAEKRKAGWDIFIKYLSDKGKIITGKEEIKTASPIQIYSSGKTIHINNQSGKNAEVSIYRIDGVKVAEQTMVSQTTTLEIPVSGFYLVSVRAGNEKPVMEKVIIR